MLEPVEAIPLGPALGGLERLVERVLHASGVLCERRGGPDRHDAGHALGVLRGEQDRPPRPGGERDEERALGAGRLHHRERVGRELALGVRLGRVGTIGPAVAAPVEADDAGVAGEIGDLRLPVARVDDRPRRQQQDRRLTGAVDLVEQAHAVALDVALLVRIAGARLLARAGRRFVVVIARSRSSSQPSIHVEQRGLAGLDPRQSLEDDPLVEGDHERDQRVQRHLDAVALVRLGERLGQHGAPFGVHVRDALAQLRAVPGERLQLEPDLLVLAVGVEVAHRRAPLLDERHAGIGVHRALPDDHALREALEHAREQRLHRAEVVVHEAVVGPCLLGEPARRDARMADRDQQALGSVEERLLGVLAG